MIFIVAALPARISHDGLAGDFVEADLHGAVAQRARGTPDAFDARREAARPLEGLHAAHAAAADQSQAGDAEMIEETGLSFDHVADCDERKVA